MIGLLLALIYLAFISLGLPDSLLGSAWPVMHISLDTPLSSMGIVTMIISLCTIISALFNDKLQRKFKTGLLTALSILLTCIGLFGFSISTEFYMLCLFAIPYGLGAGAVDSTLNNYVALHYSSRHMAWLHCFWGIGTIISPYIMSFALTQEASWNLGYRIVSLIQLAICVVISISIPIWNRAQKKDDQENEEMIFLSFKEKLKIKNLFFLLIGFFAYCALESTMMLWNSTFMVEEKGITPEIAASLASLFFIGMTTGRFICGFFSNKAGDRLLIRIGQAIIFIGIVILAIPFANQVMSIIGFLVIGLGCAPIYPCIIHSTPSNFSRRNSQAIIGLQMASAYTGATLMPPVFGLIAEHIDCAFLPFYGLVFLVLNVIMLESLNSKISKKKANKENEQIREE